MEKLEIKWLLTMQNYFCRDKDESNNSRYHRASPYWYTQGCITLNLLVKYVFTVPILHHI